MAEAFSRKRPASDDEGEGDADPESKRPRMEGEQSMAAHASEHDDDGEDDDDNDDDASAAAGPTSTQASTTTTTTTTLNKGKAPKPASNAEDQMVSVEGMAGVDVEHEQSQISVSVRLSAKPAPRRGPFASTTVLRKFIQSSAADVPYRLRGAIGEDVVGCIDAALHDRMRNIIEQATRYSAHAYSDARRTRATTNSGVRLRSDTRRQLLTLEKIEREREVQRRKEEDDYYVRQGKAKGVMDEAQRKEIAARISSVKDAEYAARQTSTTMELLAKVGAPRTKVQRDVPAAASAGSSVPATSIGIRGGGAALDEDTSSSRQHKLTVSDVLAVLESDRELGPAPYVAFALSNLGRPSPKK